MREKNEKTQNLKKDEVQHKLGFACVRLMQFFSHYKLYMTASSAIDRPSCIELSQSKKLVFDCFRIIHVSFLVFAEVGNKLLRIIKYFEILVEKK